MKKLLMTLLMGMMALGTMAQGRKFAVTGTVQGQGKKVNCVLTDAWSGGIEQKMISVTDDKVDLSFDLEQVGWLVVFNFSRTLYMLPAIPGETVTINGDVDHYTIDGSSLYRDYMEMMSVISPIQEAFWKYDFKQDCQGEIAGKSSEEVFDLYQSKLRDKFQPVTDAVMSFVREHSDQEVSMLALRALNSAEDVENAGTVISEQVLNGRMRPYYEAALEYTGKKGFSNPLLNKMAPDFRLKDIDGNTQPMSSLHGKWVLINFWYSSCFNSVSQFPMLKALHNTYKDDVVILGVDCIDDEAEWKEAVKSYDLPWLNVHEYFDVDDPLNPINLYHETATPAYFLIAPSGKVAMKGGSVENFSNVFKILFE